LTKLRSKPAVPVAGKYRLIDIPISNCINSDFNRIYVLTQFLSVSLHRHIANTYNFDAFSRGFVEILAAQQTNETEGWYQGTADAVRQQIRYVREEGAEAILILSGDQLYRMDYRKLFQTHQESQADATIAVIPVPENQVLGLGIMQLDETGRVIGFVEKPQTEAQREPLRMSPEWMEKRGIRAPGRPYLASMGIYLFNPKVLIDLLMNPPPAQDFGKEVFPRSIRTHRVQAHLFDGYWEDLGTVKAYHEANLALAQDNPPFDFYSSEGVIYTRMRYLPASRLSGAQVHQGLISDGCVIQAGAHIERSIIGVRSRIGRDALIRDSVIIGADRYETETDRVHNRKLGIPDMVVGDSCVIEKAIIDKDCHIGNNVQIINRRGLMEEEGKNYVIRDGIVVIPRRSVLPDGTVI
jgi:glucose-1-phosphate adenylyltransferase